MRKLAMTVCACKRQIRPRVKLSSVGTHVEGASHFLPTYTRATLLSKRCSRRFLGVKMKKTLTKSA